MKCLCCGKPISDLQFAEQAVYNWHKSCIKSFFGTSMLPNIDLSEETIIRLAMENTSRGFTIPGVQKKLSLHLTKGASPRLTLVNYPSGFILKPQTEEYRALPESEYLIMQMAAAAKIRTVPFALIDIGGSKAYITKRIDRYKNGHSVILAMEDFCQLDERVTEDKYKGSYERCMKIADKYSVQPGIDKTEIFLRLVFSFVTGNSDMHLKNFSLIETYEGSGQYVLSDAYDLLPVNIILPADKDETALTINGKKRRLGKSDFMTLAVNSGIPAKVAEKLIYSITSLKDTFISMCRDSYLPQDMKENLENLINLRIAKLIS